VAPKLSLCDFWLRLEYEETSVAQIVSNIVRIKESKLSDNEITVVHYMYLPKESKLFTSE